MTVYSRAKRAKEKRPKKKKIVATCIILVVIILAVTYLVISNRLLEVGSEVVPEESEIIQSNEVADETAENHDEVVDIDMEEKMGNYNVIGMLVMDKIELTKNILDISESASLKLSVAHLCGTNINESGNFCVDGHNWPNMLRRLSEMQVGDTFYIIGREKKTKVNYEIYDMYTCVPEDLPCLKQNHDGKREVTLITCNPGGGTRLICKAREI